MYFSPEKRSDFVDWLASIALAVLATAALIIVSLQPAHGQTTHDHSPYHADYYSTWKNKNGMSCCSSQAIDPQHGDCAPLLDTRLRVHGQTVEVFIDDDWVAVEPDKIRPYVPPDGTHHLCAKGKHIYCLIPAFGA